MFKALASLCALASVIAAFPSVADAQGYYRSVPSYSVPPPPPRNSRGEIIGRGVEGAYGQYEQYRDLNEWPDQQRRLWEADQQRKQQWLRDQEARRYRQQQPQFVPPHANSTPQYYPPSEGYDQRSQEWQQQHQGRQQSLDRWGRAPLPQW